MRRPPVQPIEPVLFDFRAPPLLAPATRAALESIHERFAIALRAVLTPRLRQVVDASPTGIALLSPAAYAERFTGGGARFLVSLGDVRRAEAVIQFGAELAAHCVDRLLGGAIEPGEPTRVLTGMERTVLADLAERLLPPFRDAAAAVVPLAPAGARFVAAPEAPAIVVLGETVVVLSLELRCGALAGPLDIALPLALLDGAGAPAVGDDGAAVATRVEGHLKLAHVTVTTRIGFRIAAFEIASMQAGSVLPTGHPSHADVEIAANGRRLFTGMLGRQLGHVGVRILRDAAEESVQSRTARRNSPHD